MKWALSVILLVCIGAWLVAQSPPTVANVLMCIGSAESAREVTAAYEPLAASWTPQAITPAAALRADLAAIVEDRLRAFRAHESAELIGLRDVLTAEEQTQLDDLLKTARKRVQP